MFGLLASLALLVALVSQAPIIQAQETVKLRASVVAKTFGFGPVWVASRQGFFNQQKLDVEVLLIRGSDVSTQALAGGSLQVSDASSDAPIAAFDRGLDMVIIGGIINGLSQSIMAGKNYKTYDDLRGATLGANCTIVCGTSIGEYAFVAAGAVINRDVKPYALMAGVPARHIGWMSQHGERLRLPLSGDGQAVCPATGTAYDLKDGVVRIRD